MRKLCLPLLAAGLLLLPACSGDKNTDKAALAAPVHVRPVARQSLPRLLHVVGNVKASASVAVTPRVTGEIREVHFTEGQNVKAGDPLITIDTRPFEAVLREKRGLLAKSQAQLNKALDDRGRYGKLVGGGYVSRESYEQTATEAAALKATVQSDKAAVEAASLQLTYSRITAPVGGILGLKKVDEGNMIKSSDSEGIVRITETRPCHVLFTLPENRVPLVREALRAARKGEAGRPLVQAWDREQKGLIAVGELLSMDNQIDSTTGTVKLKALFPNDGGLLYAQQFVNARVMVKLLKDAVTVPAAAVQLGSRGSYVYVVDADNVAHVRDVTPGVSTNQLAVIDKGLEPGEVVVVDGLDRLRDGITVNVAARMDTPRAEPLQ